jgi:hypothetical protein
VGTGKIKLRKEVFLAYLQPAPWLPGDILFLMDALDRGMRVEEVAGFLGRTVEEVRAQAERLRVASDRKKNAP